MEHIIRHARNNFDKEQSTFEMCSDECALQAAQEEPAIFVSEAEDDAQKIQHRDPFQVAVAHECLFSLFKIRFLACTCSPRLLTCCLDVPTDMTWNTDMLAYMQTRFACQVRNLTSIDFCCGQRLSQYLSVCGDLVEFEGAVDKLWMEIVNNGQISKFATGEHDMTIKQVCCCLLFDQKCSAHA